MTQFDLAIFRLTNWKFDNFWQGEFVSQLVCQSVTNTLADTFVIVCYFFSFLSTDYTKPSR